MNLVPECSLLKNIQSVDSKEPEFHFGFDSYSKKYIFRKHKVKYLISKLTN